MSAALDVVYRVRIGIDLVAEAIIVHQGNIHQDSAVTTFIRSFARKTDGIRMQGRFAFVQIGNILANAVIELEMLTASVSLVFEGNGHSRIKKGELAQTLDQNIELEVSDFGENLRVRQEGNLRPGSLGGSSDIKLLGSDATRKLHRVNLALPTNLDDEPFGNRIDALCAHAMQPARNLICTFAELAASMQVGQDQFQGRHVMLGVHVDRNPATIILYRTGSVVVHVDLDLRAIARQCLVDRIVQYLKNAMMKASFVSVSNVHVGALSNAFETFELLDFRGIITLTFRKFLG